jgi:hypothetical protein
MSNDPTNCATAVYVFHTQSKLLSLSDIKTCERLETTRQQHRLHFVDSGDKSNKMEAPVCYLDAFVEN